MPTIERRLSASRLTAFAARALMRSGYSLSPGTQRRPHERSADDAALLDLCREVLRRIGREHAIPGLLSLPIHPTDLPASHMARMLATAL